MDETPEELEREIEQTRDALGEKVDALVGQARMGVDVARSKGVKALGIGFAAVIGILTLKRFRRR
ncbi:MAG: DUF3618 domain-containing protein [Actinomycetota bacterium]